MSSKIWVFIDQFKGTALPASWESLGVGKTLGEVTALVFGVSVEQVAQEAFQYGALPHGESPSKQEGGLTAPLITFSWLATMVSSG